MKRAHEMFMWLAMSMLLGVHSVQAMHFLNKLCCLSTTKKRSALLDIQAADSFSGDTLPVVKEDFETMTEVFRGYIHAFGVPTFIHNNGVSLAEAKYDGCTFRWSNNDIEIVDPYLCYEFADITSLLNNKNGEALDVFYCALNNGCPIFAQWVLVNFSKKLIPEYDDHGWFNRRIEQMYKIMKRMETDHDLKTSQKIEAVMLKHMRLLGQGHVVCRIMPALTAFRPTDGVVIDRINSMHKKFMVPLYMEQTRLYEYAQKGVLTDVVINHQ